MAKHTLLLRLAGPMQAWGTQSRFTNRDTGREPSKSGVLGLLCAALGRGRDDHLDEEMLRLRMGVRVDREGRLEKDYQTARDCVRADGKTVSRDAVISDRFYLADASFLVGLEAGEAGHMILIQAQAKLADPTWQLYLGRKAFPPSEPLVFENSLRGLPLEEALKSVPWRPPAAFALAADDDPDTVARKKTHWPERLRVVLERPYGQGGCQIRQDQPDADSWATRRFGLRYVETTYFELGKVVAVEEVSDVPLEVNA